MLASSFALLIPIFILLVGALTILLLDRFIGSRERSFLALLVAVGALLFLFPLLGESPSSFVLSSWQPRMGGELACRIDHLALLFAASMTLLGLASILSSLGSGGMEATLYAALFVLLAAGLGFLFSADLITLCFGWIFLEFAILMVEATGTARRSPAGRMVQALGVFALVAAALLSRDGFSLDSSLPRHALSFVTLAALLRVGVYPLRFWEIGGVKTGERALPYLISTGTGFYLLIRIQPPDGFLMALGLLAFLAGAVLAWIEDGSLHFVAASQAGYAVLTAAVTHTVVPAINILLCLSLLFNQSRAEEKPWREAPLALALASLAGLPFTLGFVGRWFVYRSLIHRGLSVLFAPCLLAEVFLSASLFRIWFSSLPSKHSLVIHMASSASLAIPLCLLGLFPSLIRGEALPALFRSTGISLWAVLLLPPLGGYFFHRWGEQPRRLVADPASMLELKWLYGSLNWFLGRVDAIFQWITKVIEGEGYLGWALLLVLLAFLFLWTR